MSGDRFSLPRRDVIRGARSIITLATLGETAMAAASELPAAQPAAQPITAP